MTADREADAPVPELSRPPQPLWRKLLGYALGGAILFFLGIYLHRVWGQLPEGGIEIDWVLFFASCACMLVFFVLQAGVWRTIVSGLGPRIPWRRALKYWFFSQVAKYVPGKVMLPLMRTRYCLREGASVQGVLLSITIELILMVLTGLFLAILAAGAQLAEVSKGFVWLYAILIPAGLVGIHPRILEPVVNFGLRLIRRKPIEIALAYRSMLLLFLLFFAGWLFYGGSSYLLCAAVSDAVALDQLPLIVGLFAVAWLAGFLSFVTPGGIGVREGVLVLLLAPVMPEAQAALIALITRLQWTGIEIAAAGALLMVKGPPR